MCVCVYGLTHLISTLPKTPLHSHLSRQSLNGSDAEVVSIKATLVRKMKEISSVWKDAEPQIDEHIGFFYQDTAANALERFGALVRAHSQPYYTQTYSQV